MGTRATVLRPFTAKAEILPEQLIGCGLRLMAKVGRTTEAATAFGVIDRYRVRSMEDHRLAFACGGGA